MICSSLHGDLKQPVLEIGAYPAAVYAFRQVHGPSEVPVVALSGVETHILRFALALPVDGQDAAGEGDLHVLLSHASELATYHQIVALGEDVGGGNPGGSVGPPLVFLPPALGVLSHPGHLAHVVHEPPKWVARPAHLPSFLFSPAAPIRRAGGFGHPPRLSLENYLDTKGFLTAGLFGVLRRHLLRRRGALRTGHSPARLRRLESRCDAGHPLLAQRSHDGEAQPDQDEHERRR